MSNPFKVIVVVAAVIAVALVVGFGFVVFGHATYRYPASAASASVETI